MIDLFKEWDRELFVFLNNLGIENYDSFWLFVTQIQTWIPLFVLFIVLLFYYHKVKKGLIFVVFLLITVGLTILFTDLVKDYVSRLRPNNVEALAELIRALKKPTNYSFFSGHASSSFAATTFVVLSLRKHTHWIFLAYLWPLIFAMSRIYVGVHYPSDLIVGAFVGVSFAIGGYLLCVYILRKLPK